MLLFSTVITGGSTVSSGVQPPMNASGMAASNACEFTEKSGNSGTSEPDFFEKKETAPDGIPFMCGLFCFKLP